MNPMTEKQIMKTIFEYDQCGACGDSLEFEQDPSLPEGHLWEDQELHCMNPKCKASNSICFNDDGSFILIGKKNLSR